MQVQVLSPAPAGSPRGQFRVSVFLGRELFSAHESHLFNIDTSFKKSDYSDFFLLLSSIPILVPGNEAQKLYFMCMPTYRIAAGLPVAYPLSFKMIGSYLSAFSTPIKPIRLINTKQFAFNSITCNCPSILLH